jgi:transposase
MKWGQPWTGDDEDARAIPYLPPPRRGRPRSDGTHPERIKHIRAAYLVLVAGYRPEQVAKAYKVTGKTIYRWVDLVKGYTDPEASALREMCGIEPAEGRGGEPGEDRSPEPGEKRRRGRPHAAPTAVMRQAVQAMERGKFPAHEIAARYGVNRATLYRWCKLYGQ